MASVYLAVRSLLQTIFISSVIFFFLFFNGLQLHRQGFDETECFGLTLEIPLRYLSALMTRIVTPHATRLELASSCFHKTHYHYAMPTRAISAVFLAASTYSATVHV